MNDKKSICADGLSEEISKRMTEIRPLSTQQLKHLDSCEACSGLVSECVSQTYRFDLGLVRIIGKADRARFWEKTLSEEGWVIDFTKPLCEGAYILHCLEYSLSFQVDEHGFVDLVEEELEYLELCQRRKAMGYVVKRSASVAARTKSFYKGLDCFAGAALRTLDRLAPLQRRARSKDSRIELEKASRALTEAVKSAPRSPAKCRSMERITTLLKWRGVLAQERPLLEPSLRKANQRHFENGWAMGYHPELRISKPVPFVKTLARSLDRYLARSIGRIKNLCVDLELPYHFNLAVANDSLDLVDRSFGLALLMSWFHCVDDRKLRDDVMFLACLEKSESPASLPLAPARHEAVRIGAAWEDTAIRTIVLAKANDAEAREARLRTFAHLRLRGIPFQVLDGDEIVVTGSCQGSLIEQAPRPNYEGLTLVLVKEALHARDLFREPRGR